MYGEWCYCANNNLASNKFNFLFYNFDFLSQL